MAFSAIHSINNQKHAELAPKSSFSQLRVGSKTDTSLDRQASTVLCWWSPNIEYFVTFVAYYKQLSQLTYYIEVNYRLYNSIDSSVPKGYSWQLSLLEAQRPIFGLLKLVPMK